MILVRPYHHAMNARGLLLALLVLLTSANARAGLVEDMAAFERIYIPALALTNQPQQPAARVAASVQRLAAAWPGVRQAFVGASEPLARAVRTTDEAIGEAQALLAKGMRVEAHDALERVRPAFVEARRAAGMELYVDRLTEFHDAMEQVVKLAASAAAPGEIRQRLEEASGLWRRAEEPRFEAALFGFDDAKYEQLRKRIGGERALIEALRKALAANDRTQVGALAKEMKAAFSQIYVMFGDFEGF